MVLVEVVLLDLVGANFFLLGFSETTSCLEVVTTTFFLGLAFLLDFILDLALLIFVGIMALWYCGVAALWHCAAVYYHLPNLIQIIQPHIQILIDYKIGADAIDAHA